MGLVTTMIDPDLLTVAARRRLLCELADLYVAEQDRRNRPISDALPALLPHLSASHVTVVTAIDLFDRFARQRAQLDLAETPYDQMAAAADVAERLLDELVGETL